MGKKWLRILVGALFLIFLIVTFIPRLYLSISTDGVVNARTLTLRTPIEGIVEYPTSLHHGAFYKKGELIGSVVNQNLDSSFLHKLITEKMTLESRVEIMKKRIRSYQDLSDILKENLMKYQHFSIYQYEMQIKQIDAQLKREQAEYDRAKLEHAANAKLYEKNAIKLRAVESSYAAFIQSQSRLLELKNRRDELDNRLRAAQEGVFMGDGNNDVPYSNQRRDQLVIETALAEAALSESLERIKGIDKQVESEKKRLEYVKKYEIRAPFDGLVWRIPSGNKSSVAINSELLTMMDCGTVFLDVTLPERKFAQITRGDHVNFRLRGEDHFHQGTVSARRGSGTQGQLYELAAITVNDPKKEFRLWIDVNPEDLELTQENFYRIGQRVDVKFPKRISPFRDIKRFLNVF